MQCEANDKTSIPGIWVKTQPPTQLSFWGLQKKQATSKVLHSKESKTKKRNKVERICSDILDTTLCQKKFTERWLGCF